MTTQMTWKPPWHQSLHACCLTTFGAPSVLQRFHRCSSCSRHVWPRVTSTRDCELGTTAASQNLCGQCKTEQQPRNRRGRPLRSLFFSPATPDEDLLQELGVSPDTFRTLRALEGREITPDDYDTLLKLHSKQNTKTGPSTVANALVPVQSHPPPILPVNPLTLALIPVAAHIFLWLSL